MGREGGGRGRREEKEGGGRIEEGERKGEGGENDACVYMHMYIKASCPQEPKLSLAKAVPTPH